MKAEHRKELQTNLLADRMGRLVQGMKSGPRATSVGVWVLALLTLAVVVGMYFANSSRGKQSAAWVHLDAATRSGNEAAFQGVIRDYPGTVAAEAAFQGVIQDYPGTVAARTARFQRARLVLHRGLDGIYERDAERRKDAIQDLESARLLFRELASECVHNDVLEPEAILGEAKAEEALVRVPQEANADQGRGDLDRALSLYRQVADRFPNTFRGQQAAARAAELDKNRADVEDFYARLNKLESAPKP